MTQQIVDWHESETLISEDPDAEEPDADKPGAKQLLIAINAQLAGQSPTTNRQSRNG